MSGQEYQSEGKYPNPFGQNELKGGDHQENAVEELNRQMNQMGLGSEPHYRKESTPLPQNPITSKVMSNPLDSSTKANSEAKTNSFLHKMSDGSLNDITKSKGAFNLNQQKINLREGTKMLKGNGNGEKYLPPVNYLSNSTTSPICSYYDSSQRYFSHSLQKETQNEELDQIPESHNFIMKSSIEDDMEPKAYQQQDIGNPFNNIEENEESNGYEEYANLNPQAFNQYNFFNQNNPGSNRESPQINPGLLPNYGLTHQNLFRPNQQATNSMIKPKGKQSAIDFGTYPIMPGINDEDEGNEQNDNDNHSSQEDSNQSLHSDDYIFEKYGKKGWMCEKCNNFNFESK